MTTESTTQEFHKRAKEAGDQLRAYIVSISSAATGMLFLNVTDATQHLTNSQKVAVAIAIIMFSLTVMLTLIELRVNARRFYEVATQREKDAPNWNENTRLKALRLKIMWGSYGTMSTGIIATLFYMLMRI